MTEDKARSLREIFDEVIELPADQRSEALQRLCAGDTDLQKRVEALLEAANDSAFLVHPTAGSGDAAQPDQDPTRIHASGETVGQQIDRFKLLEKIGEGGFGTVWAAEQKEPVKRRVALKIIKLGMDTEQVIARFEAERQALALMDHPNIAKVLDAGATETGRPFFVMELVRGVPILEYCDREQLDTTKRLTLFRQVCHAIQHAHQKGIIHRDIKPSNVLVTMHDGVPVPKVIDFGIAKATNQELTEKTIYTQHQQMIGTPAYMSPEQAEMSGLDIDTRSDIYSLGVLLYELLTGTTPFTRDELLSAGFEGMMRLIREVEPHKPSTRLQSLGDAATRTAQQRRVDVRQLGTILRGDLDWIVMKCLEKDRTQRYETASGLADDVQRHLANEPVLASPPTTGYKLRKFVQRNKGQVIAASIVAAALVLGVIGTTFGLVWALQEKSRADQATDAERIAKVDAQDKEKQAVAQAERAERELERATEIKRLITEMLSSVTPDEALEEDTTLLKRILDNTAERLQSGEITDPTVAGELQHLIGTVYREIGLYDQSEVHLKEAGALRTAALGPDHADTLITLDHLADCYLRQDRLDEGSALAAELVERSVRAFGPDHTKTREFRNGLAAVYVRMKDFDKVDEILPPLLAQAREDYGPEDIRTMRYVKTLAAARQAQHRHAEAVELHRLVVKVHERVYGPDDRTIIVTRGNLATCLKELGQFPEAAAEQHKVLDSQRRIEGPEHPETLAATTNLGNVYADIGMWDEAIELFETSLPIKRRVLGEDHVWTMAAISSLANAYQYSGRAEDAEPLHLEGLALARKKFGEEDYQTIGRLTNLGMYYTVLGRYEDAAKAFEQSAPIKVRVLGIEHPWTGIALKGLADAYLSLDRTEDVRPVMLQLIEHLDPEQLESPSATENALARAAWVYQSDVEGIRDLDKALGYIERAIELAEQTGSTHLLSHLETRAIIHSLQGEPTLAIETVQRALTLQATDRERTVLQGMLKRYQEQLADDGD